MVSLSADHVFLRLVVLISHLTLAVSTRTVERLAHLPRLHGQASDALREVAVERVAVCSLEYRASSVWLRHAALHEKVARQLIVNIDHGRCDPVGALRLGRILGVLLDLFPHLLYLALQLLFVVFGQVWLDRRADTATHFVLFDVEVVARILHVGLTPEVCESRDG